MDLQNELKKRLGKFIEKYADKGASGIFLDIDKANIKACSKILLDELDARFITATAADHRAGIEVLYHFAVDPIGAMVSIRLFLENKKDPELDSLCNIIKASHWIEREIHELFGVNFTGNPNLKHLLLGDDWPEGDYPLRKNNDR